MTTEIAIAPRVPSPWPFAESIRRRIVRLDGVERLLLVVFALESCWVLGIDLWESIARGHVWTGTDGVFITDQMQYLGWIQSAARHGLISNMFVLHGTPADYFQPCVIVSALLVRLGVAPTVALMLWKPVAVLATFFGIRAFAHHALPGARQRHVAIALGLFYGSFTFLYGSYEVIGDLSPGFLSWGYPFGLIALGGMLYGTVLYDRARRAGRLTLWPAALGALASILHPWNGETMIAVVALAELLRLRSDPITTRRVTLCLTTCVGAALPLLYYLILGRSDPAWEMAREASKHSFSFWLVLSTLAPILPFAALAFRRRPESFFAVAVRVFPLVCVAIFFFSASGASATPLHAFQGITVPLGVLAVQGLATTPWERWRRRRTVGAVGLALATIPASVWLLHVAPQYMGPSAHNANFIQVGERDALQYLRTTKTPGGVLSNGYLGLTVPARTGRQTFVGDCLWSEPDCAGRTQFTGQLFSGTLPATYAQRVVSHSGARFVLADCGSSVGLERELGLLVTAVHRFGCATVYQLTPLA